MTRTACPSRRLAPQVTQVRAAAPCTWHASTSLLQAAAYLTIGSVWCAYRQHQKLCTAPHNALGLQACIIHRALSIPQIVYTEASDRCPESILCNAAPEVIANSRTYDGKLADVWSSGVMLYVMLFCEYPFERAEDAADPHRFQRVSFPSHPIQRRPQQQLRMLLVLYLCR